MRTRTPCGICCWFRPVWTAWCSAKPRSWGRSRTATSSPVRPRPPGRSSTGCFTTPSSPPRMCTLAPSISNGRVSVAGVAVELARQLFADIARARVVVIGAGSTGELVVQHLLKAGCTDVTVVNRSYERGEDLARRRGSPSARWEELDQQIAAGEYRDLLGGGRRTTCTPRQRSNRP